MEKQLAPSLAAIFDMDGVLVDNNPFHKEAWGIFCQRDNLKIDLSQAKSKIFGRSNGELLSELFDRPLSEQEKTAMGEEKESIYRDLFSAHIKPVPGLIEWLNVLKDSKIPMAVASSAPPSNVEFVLDKLNLRGFFKFYLTGNDVKKAKPDPEVYQIACAKMGLPPKQCIVFEDSLAGIEAAHGAGTTIVGITTTHSPSEMKHVQVASPNFHFMSIVGLRGLI